MAQGACFFHVIQDLWFSWYGGSVYNFLISILLLKFDYDMVMIFRMTNALSAYIWLQNSSMLKEPT